MNAQLIEYLKLYFNVDTLLFLDFETFFKTKANAGTKSFSLKSLPYYDYILSPRFHTTGLSVAEDDGDIEYIHDPDEIQELMDELRERREGGERILLLAHNVVFDGAIANWRYNVSFDAYLCTMMLRTLNYPNRKAGLGYAARDAWPEDESLQKGGKELMALDGVKYEYITDEQHESLGEYAIQDTNLMRRLMFEYLPDVLSSRLEHELMLMHITARGNIEPQFRIRRSLLEEVLVDEAENEKRLVKEATEFAHKNGVKVSRSTFSSNPKYAELLRKMDIAVPMKISKTTGEIAPALGQNDPEYVRTQIDHPDLMPLYKARAAVKSTIAASRAKRMIHAADLFKEHGFTHAEMPFFLNYMGARQTGRWSGGQKLNQQNNTRGGKHRLSMLAPEGHQIGVVDLSNIELRVNLWLCGQNDILHQMESDPKYDYYCDVAGGIFNREIIKGVDKDERQMGKATGLGLGFAMGWFGFQRYLASGPLGMEPMFKDDEFCRKVKGAYDQKHPAIVLMWRFINTTIIPVLINGGELRFGPNASFVASKDQIKLPSGRVLRYENCRYQGMETNRGIETKIVFDSDKFDRFDNPIPKFMWHGLLLENMVQATAREILGVQIVHIEKKLQKENYGHVMGSVHDETLACLRDETVEIAFDAMSDIMSKPPVWAQGLPLANEGGWALEYSK